MTLTTTLRAALVTGAVLASAPAFAAGCDKIIFSDVGWTDITATTATAATVLQALGYETDVKVLSVPLSAVKWVAEPTDSLPQRSGKASARKKPAGSTKKSTT